MTGRSGAQWILVGTPELGDSEACSILKAVLEDWTVPSECPAGVVAFVQAGVDGDWAAIHCRDAEVENGSAAIMN